jgi:hypothetical protein
VIATIRKALAAAVFGTAGALGTAMLDGNLTGTEAIASAGAGLVAGYAVWQIKNRRD